MKDSINLVKLCNAKDKIEARIIVAFFLLTGIITYILTLVVENM